MIKIFVCVYVCMSVLPVLLDLNSDKYLQSLDVHVICHDCNAASDLL